MKDANHPGFKTKTSFGMIAYWYENLTLCLPSHSRLVQQTCPEWLDWTKRLEFVCCQIIPNIKVLWKYIEQNKIGH